MALEVRRRAELSGAEAEVAIAAVEEAAVELGLAEHGDVPEAAEQRLPDMQKEADKRWERCQAAEMVCTGDLLLSDPQASFASVDLRIARRPAIFLFHLPHVPLLAGGPAIRGQVYGGAAWDARRG